MRRAVLWFVTVSLLEGAAAAQGADRYLLLATTSTGTMQREIDEAADRGYRVIAASRTEGAEVIVAMEQAEGPYRYRLVATTRTGTLQREISEAAQAGYRVVPRAVTTKRSLGNVLSGPESRNEGELLIVMEKGPTPLSGLAYQVLATNRTGTLQKEMSQMAARGYTLVALSSRGEHVAIFERHD